MRPRAVLLAIAGILDVGCHGYSSTDGCKASDKTETFTLEEVCGVSHQEPCTAPATCEAFCKERSPYMVSCRVLTAKTPSDPVVECTEQTFCKGRRPAGLASISRADAHLEAASVIAFARLAHDLRVHRAPKRLVRAARRSRRDELVHTRLMRALEDAPFVRPVVAPYRERSLLEIAIENAVEGCVRETFGAAVARWQAKRRSVYSRIARDEARHAVLAHEVDRFLFARLRPDERRVVRATQRDAITELRREVEAAVEREDDPPKRVALAWLDSFARSLVGA